MLTPWMKIHFQLAAMAPKCSRKGERKATARAKLPTLVMNRPLSLVREHTKGFISAYIRRLKRIYNVCGVKDELAWDLFYDKIFLDPVTTCHFSQFQLLWPHRRSRSSPFREWWAAFRSYIRQMFDRGMNAWQDYVSHKIDISRELEADYNVPKIHLVSHWAKQIRRYRALHQYSAERHQQAHKTTLKDSWNASNHNPNYLPQVITFQRRIVCFEMSELNLQALTQSRLNSTATCKVLPSGADLAAPLSPGS